MLWRRKLREDDLERELRADLECEAEERRAAGLAADEARLAALRAFGNTALVKEDTRAMWGWTFIDRLRLDLNYAWRGMRRSPGFTATVTLSLALGIGANTAIFSLIDAVLLRQLPVRDPQELVQLIIGRPDPEPLESFSYPLIRALAEHREIFAGLCGFSSASFVVGRGEALETTPGAWVTGGYYATLGLQPAAGRLLTESDDAPGAARAAVISDDYWERHFRRSPAAIGQEIFVEGQPVTIVGVGPAEFRGADVGANEDITMALGTYLQFKPDPYQVDAGAWWLRVLARPRAGISREQLNARLATVWRPLWDSVLPANMLASRRRLEHTSLLAVSGSTGYTDLRRRFRKPLLVLMGVVGLLLAIACANVANLLLARAAARQREIAVRLAIGASRRRIVRQLLTESLLHALLGGSLGVLLAFAGSRFLVNLLSGAQTQAIALDLAPDWRVLAFTGAAASAVGILAGLAPAFRGTAAGPAAALGERSAITRSRLAGMLVAAQMALALLLLIGAGLFVNTLRNLHRVDAGFRQDGVLLVNADGSPGGRRGAAMAAFYEDLLARIEGLPDVQSASYALITPLRGGGISQPVAVNGVPTGTNEIHFNGVSRRFFETMATPVERGREFTLRDGPGSPLVAVVNEVFARRYLHGEPLGQRLTIGSRANAGSLEQDYQVVGVVKNSIYESLWTAAPPTVYVPVARVVAARGTERGVQYEVHAAGSLAQVAAELRTSLQPLFPSAPLRVDTLTEQVERALVQERMMATLASAFGTVGLALAAVGLYGLLAYFVARRTREIGIRLALGARREKVLWLVARQALGLLGIGIVVGVPAAWAMSRLVSSMLFGLKTTDPWTIGGAAAVLGAVGLAAGIVPAWRAARIDPMAALRHE